MKKLIVAGLLVSTLFISCNSNPAADKEKVTVEATNKSSTVQDLAAEKDIKKLLCQNWENKEDAADIAASGGGSEIEMPYRGFSFFEDGVVTENPKDKIRFSKWKLDDATKIIEIEPVKGPKHQYKIAAIGPKQMVLLDMADNKKTEYIADGKKQITATDDPLYPFNNEWRIKPAKAESDAEIKARAEKSVLFYAKYLNDNSERGLRIISFAGLPTCFKWYRGGVSIMGKEKLENSWINCFYNKEQAQKAQEMIENIISKKYKWNKEERNWVKQSADVVKQMYDTLRLTSVAQ